MSVEQYNVTGMSCAACSARVEKAVSQVEGVTSCSVSLLTNSMGVEGSASPDAVIAAVKEAGYGASVRGNTPNKSGSSSPDEDSLSDRETPVLKRRLTASLGFLVVQESKSKTMLMEANMLLFILQDLFVVREVLRQHFQFFSVIRFA